MAKPHESCPRLAGIVLALACLGSPGSVAGQQAPAAAPSAPAVGEAQAGSYALDKTHASVVFRVSHLGLSRYTARFTRLDATLEFDPARPAGMGVKATIDPRSIRTDFPLPTPDFDAVLAGPDWLDAARFPEIAFRSTRIELTGPRAARVAGELALHGVTRPVTLTATFNGGYAGHPMDPGGSRIGFSAHGSLKRSEFGISAGVPPAGTTFGVGDEVEFSIEVEFLRPAAGAGKPAR